jgi:hypothetical protein
MPTVLHIVNSSRWSDGIHRSRRRRPSTFSGDDARFPPTSIYLQGIDSSEIIDTVHARPAPTISATAGLSQL